MKMGIPSQLILLGVRLVVAGCCGCGHLSLAHFSPQIEIEMMLRAAAAHRSNERPTYRAP